MICIQHLTLIDINEIINFLFSFLWVYWLRCLLVKVNHSHFIFLSRLFLNTLSLLLCRFAFFFICALLLVEIFIIKSFKFLNFIFICIYMNTCFSSFSFRLIFILIMKFFSILFFFLVLKSVSFNISKISH